MTGTQRRVIGLVAVATWLTIDLIRFAGPLISDLFDIGVEVAAGAAFATFAGGGVLAYFATLIGRRIGHGNVILAQAAALVVLRILLPFLEGEALVLYGLIAMAMSVELLLLAVRGAGASGGAPTIMAASGLGAIVAVLEQGILVTWDAIWRDDILAIGFTALLCASLLWTAWRTRNDTSERPVRGLWAYGLWFSILAFAFANLAFMSSQSGFHLGVAIVLSATGLGAGMYLAARMPNLPMAAVAALGATAVLAVWTLVSFQGAVLVVMAPVAIATTTYLTSRALSVAAEGAKSGPRFLGAAAAFGVLALLPFMLVQLDYDMPLGIPHLLIIVISAFAIAGGAVVRSRAQQASRTLIAAATGYRLRTGILAVASVLIGAFTLLTFNGAGSAPSGLPSELKMVSWNVHYGVTPGLGGGPDVDLDAIAAEIASQNPDVVMIQEVTRGWILAGGTDILQYLADALNMHYVYVGAHDHQFGNAILSRYEFTDVQRITLPYGTGPQGRSAMVASIETASGPIQFTAIHLQHKDDDSTRVEQAEAFLAEVSDAPAAVVAGDFNDTPESEVIELMLERFASAQDDLVGEADTYNGADFHARIDYAFYEGVTITDFVIGDSPLSDHFSFSFTVAVDN